MLRIRYFIYAPQAINATKAESSAAVVKPGRDRVRSLELSRSLRLPERVRCNGNLRRDIFLGALGEVLARVQSVPRDEITAEMYRHPDPDEVLAAVYEELIRGRGLAAFRSRAAA
jgi:hypothetical protein